MKGATPAFKQNFFLACCALLLLVSGCAQHTGQRPSDDAAAAPSAANIGQPARVSSADADAAEPATAAAPDGSVYVAWVEHRRNDEADVMLARFNDAGQMQGEPARVNPEAGRATAWRGDPPTVAASTDGIVYVGWTARVEPSSANDDELYLSASRDGGRSFAAPVKVNDDQRPALHGMHSLAVAPDGRVYLAWLDERNVTQPRPSEMAEGHHMESNLELFTAYSTDGGRTFSPNRRVAADACPCCKTALAVGPDKRLYVSWRQVLPGDFRHIAVASSEDGGETYSQPVIVSDDRWQIAGCPVSGPALAVGADGALRVLWYSEGQAGEAGLYWSESVNGGRTFTPRRLLSSGRASGTPVLLTGGSITSTAIWGTGSGSSARLMTAAFGGDARVTQSAGTMSGELPSSAKLGGSLFIAYITKSDGQRRSIWLARRSA
jgi:BNR repeat-like domain